MVGLRATTQAAAVCRRVCVGSRKREADDGESRAQSYVRASTSPRVKGPQVVQKRQMRTRQSLWPHPRDPRSW
eukprot:4530463-Prymnesium_polylepis.1